jgi:hypothetical protein
MSCFARCYRYNVYYYYYYYYYYIVVVIAVIMAFTDKTLCFLSDD